VYDALQACAADATPACFDCIERVYGTIVSTLMTAVECLYLQLRKDSLSFGDLLKKRQLSLKQ